MTSMAPDWADTTVRWLRSNHPEFVSASSSLTVNVIMHRGPATHQLPAPV